MIKKAYIIMGLLCLLLLSSCGGAPSREEAKTAAEGGLRYDGSATTIEIKDIQLKVEGKDSGPQVIFSYDDKGARVELEGPEDMLAALKVSFKNNALSIGADAGVRYVLSKPLVIRLIDQPLDKLEKLALEGCQARSEAQTGLGSFYAYYNDGPNSPQAFGPGDSRLEVVLSGASTLIIPDIKAGAEVKLELTESSRLETEYIQTKHWKVDMGGASFLKADMVSAESADWHIAGASRMELPARDGDNEARGENLFAVLTGASHVQGYGLAVKKATLTISGASVLYCAVSEVLGGSISGVSSVYYLGDPVLATSLGSGSVLEKK